MTKIIWIDLDEVLAETVDKVLEKNNNIIWDLYFEKEHLTNYYIYNIPWINIDKNKAIDYFRWVLYYDHNLEIKPVLWALEKLLEFKNKGYVLKVITARADDLENYTNLWLEKYFPGIFSEVYFANHFTDNHKEKSEICKDLNLSMMIEDNYDYALDLANNWIKTYLIERPWNKELDIKHENIIRFKHWGDIWI